MKKLILFISITALTYLAAVVVKSIQKKDFLYLTKQSSIELVETIKKFTEVDLVRHEAFFEELLTNIDQSRQFIGWAALTKTKKIQAEDFYKYVLEVSQKRAIENTPDYFWLLTEFFFQTEPHFLNFCMRVVKSYSPQFFAHNCIPHLIEKDIILQFNDISHLPAPALLRAMSLMLKKCPKNRDDLIDALVKNNIQFDRFNFYGFMAKNKSYVSTSRLIKLRNFRATANPKVLKAKIYSTKNHQDGCVEKTWDNNFDNENAPAIIK